MGEHAGNRQAFVHPAIVQLTRRSIDGTAAPV